MPGPLPPGPTVNLQPLFRGHWTFPKALGPRPGSFPRPEGPGILPLLHPQTHQVLCLQTVPARLSQGPGAVPCHGAVSTPPQLPLERGSLRFQGPLFTEVQTGGGEGWEPFTPVQARLVKIKVSLPGICSLSDCFSLPSHQPQHGTPETSKAADWSLTEQH